MLISGIRTLATDVGSECDLILSGFEEVFLVPIGDGLTTWKRPELIEFIPELTAAFKIDLEPEASQLKCKYKRSAAGAMFENTFSFNSVRNVSDWIYENRFGKFWLLLKQGTRWIITGDDQLPYTIGADYDSGKQIQDRQGWDFTLVSDQDRAYFIYNDTEDEG